MADDQHDAAAAAHLHLLEELLELQEGRMGALHARFGADLRSIQEEFERWVLGAGCWVGAVEGVEGGVPDAGWLLQSLWKVGVLGGGC